MVVIKMFRIIRPTHRAIIERLGKYNRFANPGFNFVIPILERCISVNVTEQMVDVGRREFITKDDLNANIEAQIYFKVKPDEADVKNAIYKVFNFKYQIVELAKTTLRDIIGNMDFKQANSSRNVINKTLTDELRKETNQWGIEVIRAELKEIEPPEDVQETMNEIIKADNKRDAAKRDAEAAEIKADGLRRAAIKEASGERDAAILEAQGLKKYTILKAEGDATAIEKVNLAIEKTFKEKAQLLKKLDTLKDTLASNTKIIVPKGSNLLNVLGDLGGFNKGSN